MNTAVLLAAGGAALVAYNMFQTRGMTFVRLGARDFYVKDLPGKQEVAAVLARLEATMATFRAFLSTSKHRDDVRARRILTRWDGTLSETDWHNRHEAAYSLDKGRIFICVRDDSGRVQDFNTAVFVLLHELAHVCTTDTGHTPAFWRNMTWLLKLAVEETKLYRYQRFETAPSTYCGHPIANSPYTCVVDKTCTV